MIRGFGVIKDVLVTTAATASLVSLVYQAQIDPLLKGFALGFLTASMMSLVLAYTLLLKSKKTS